MPEIRFRAFGNPKAQPRPRAFAKKMPYGVVARVYDDGSAESWKGQIAIAAAPHLPPRPIETPVSLTLVFWFARPASLMRKKDPDAEMPHTSKPDIENCVKAVMDAGTQLGIWRDDRLVSLLTASKWWVPKNGEERPGLHFVATWSELAAAAAGDGSASEPQPPQPALFACPAFDDLEA